VEWLALLATMDAHPRANRGLDVERQGCYRPYAVSIGSQGHGSSFAQQLGMEDMRRVFARLRDSVGDVVMPDGPDDARQLIGDGARGLVIPAACRDGTAHCWNDESG
jgi:hypothetical protein